MNFSICISKGYIAIRNEDTLSLNTSAEYPEKLMDEEETRF